MALLTLDQVRRRFGGIVAVNDVSFDVSAGEVAGLIGPNGAGKTTLFNLITRLYRADAGSIVFDDEDLLRRRPHEIVRLGIARTFQNVELFKTMTALENVLVGAAPGVTEARALELLDYTGAAANAHRVVVGLPFATLKQIELARALATQPKLLLLDEPAGGLSHEEVERLGTLLSRLPEDFAVTVLLVEHHMQLVMRISHRVHVLDFGRLIASGTPGDVRADPAVIEAYLGAEVDATA